MDPEGKTIVYTCDGQGLEPVVPEWMVFHTFNRTLNGWPPNTASVDKLVLKASDGIGGEVEIDFSVEVKPIGSVFPMICIGFFAIVAFLMGVGAIALVLTVNVSEKERSQLGLNQTDFIDEMTKKYEPTPNETVDES